MRYVELDVQMSSDGELVVIHDETVDRTTDGQGAVGELTFAQLRALDAGSHFGSQFAGEKYQRCARCWNCARMRVWA